MIGLRAFAWPAAVLVAALIAGFVVGAAAAAVVAAIGLCAIIGWHVSQLARLARWSSEGLDAAVPESRGLWGVVFSRIHRRVRARAAIERDLTHTLERFRDAAEAIPDGMVVLDAQNRIRWANRRAEQQLAVATPADAGAPLANLLREPAFIRYLDGGDFGGGVVLPSPREPGVTLAMQLVPFGVDEKLLIVRDITEREAVTRRHRDFIANVSHELKTPLTVVSGFVETLRDLDLDEHQRDRYLALMQEQTASMRRLVADLLTLSGLESDDSPPADTRFAIAPLVDALAADARALSAGAHEIVLGMIQPAEVIGSREELASAFANLVSNAIRYTPAHGRVTLSFHVDADGSGVFGVADTGIGIAPEHVPRLTERFYRVDRSRSRATGGTGLGLAIVKHILLRHRATLEIASTPGTGSMFSARLPAQRVVPMLARPERAPDAVESSGAAYQ
jgi:two-component system, OmpR family, phosphate regulon sensor histidine kinase PhoR